MNVSIVDSTAIHLASLASKQVRPLAQQVGGVVPEGANV
jgi:hypothetical protein